MNPQIKQILEWSGEPERALQDFEAFLLAHQSQTGATFQLESSQAKKLLTLFGNSHFLSQFLIRQPEIAEKAIESSFLEKEKHLKIFQQDLAELFPNLSRISEEEFGKKIRIYRYSEFLRLTIKDLSQSGSMESILNELSSLAISIIQICFEYFFQQLSKEFGKPFIFENEKKIKPCGFNVIAQGKLGGNELNYSSDVDLQYIYESEGKTDSITNHEFYVKLSKKISHFLSEKTEDGFLYRVDLNLRPEGKSGALANSLSALENYYETFGAEWERQALIKATPIAGDSILGEDFKKLIDPFVWRKSLDLKSIENFKEMKNKLHDSTKKTSAQGFNVKLGEGGIREIEFFVQILQLLYGGKHPELRIASTLKTIHQLEKLNLIKSQESLQLKDAYLFLRKVEHRLQLVHESQTHLIPPGKEEQQQLARRMGYFGHDREESRERFLEDLSRYTTMVKTIFQSLFA